MVHFNPAEARGPHGRWTRGGAALKRMATEASGRPNRNADLADRVTKIATAIQTRHTSLGRRGNSPAAKHLKSAADALHRGNLASADRHMDLAAADQNIHDASRQAIREQQSAVVRLRNAEPATKGVKPARRTSQSAARPSQPPVRVTAAERAQNPLERIRREEAVMMAGKQGPSMGPESTRTSIPSVAEMMRRKQANQSPAQAAAQFAAAQWPGTSEYIRNFSASEAMRSTAPPSRKRKRA